ncbi:MAG TPA: CIA30 family protein [Steroidobacteraceae bacterium]
MSEGDPAPARDAGLPVDAGAAVRVLVDFDEAADFRAWQPVDDVVMGGVSRSSLQAATASVARFGGEVSLARGGGFASVRTEPRAWPTAGATALVLRCHGDGRTYKFTLRIDDGFDGVQYQARFTPAPGVWTIVRLRVAAFVATFRGRQVAGSDPLAPERIRRLGLMVSDRQAGPFELLVDWIAVATD